MRIHDRYFTNITDGDHMTYLELVQHTINHINVKLLKFVVTVIGILASLTGTLVVATKLNCAGHETDLCIADKTQEHIGVDAANEHKSAVADSDG